MRIKIYHVALVILIGLGIIACTRDESVGNSSKNNEELLLQQAKAWYQENTEFAKVQGSTGIDVTAFGLDWSKKTFLQNKSGNTLISVPIEGAIPGFSVGIMNFLISKEGGTYGVYKVFKDNPDLQDTEMAFYSGTGQLIVQGYYNRSKKTFVTPIGGYSAQAGLHTTAFKKELEQEIDEVVVPGKSPSYPTPPTIPYIPPTNPSTPPNTGFPPYDPGKENTNPYSSGSGQQDPCSKAKGVVGLANNTLRDSNIMANVVNKMDENKAASNEFARSVGRDVDGKYTFSELVEGGVDNASVPSPPGAYVTNAHTHNDGGSPPSGVDFYTTLKIADYDNAFIGSYVFAANGDVYMLAVNDRDALRAFLQKYPKSENLGRKEFNTNTDFGQDYNKIRDCYTSGRCKGTNSTEQSSGVEAGLAYVLEKYKTGISLLKGDKNGNFKGITTKEGKVYDPVNKEYKDGYVSDPCKN
ncbi:hypothetical protein HZP46_02005 [Elizabethkingia anophelis]|nr:hypothetical protein [Elizabethkingia anophelis]